MVLGSWFFVRNAGFPLITCTVYGTPTGDITILLPLIGRALESILDANPGGVDLPFQITAVLQDPADDTKTEQVTLLEQVITLQQTIGGPALLTAPVTDWLIPPLPASYVPAVVGATVTGQQFQSNTFGDGTATTFVISHGMSTEDVFLDVFDNSTGDCMLHGVDYSWKVLSPGGIQIKTPTAPGVGALKYVIVGSQSITAIAGSFTINEANVNNLPTDLASLTSQLATITSALGLGATLNVPGTSPALVAGWTLPAFQKVFPAHAQPPTWTAIADLIKPDRSAVIPGKPVLFGALEITSGAATDITTGSVPASPTASILYRNNSGGSLVTLPGVGRNPSYSLPNLAMATWDGRGWYHVSNLSGSDAFALGTWYPTNYDLEVCEVAVTKQMLASNSILQIQIGLELAILQGNCDAQYLLYCEWGYATKDTGTGSQANLSSMNWQTTAVKVFPILLTADPTVHTFGLTCTRSLPIVGGSPTDTLAVAVQQYGATIGADSAPTAAHLNGSTGYGVGFRFFLRGLDPEDVAAPSGYIAVRGPNISVGGQPNTSGAGVGYATITANQPVSA